MLFSQVVFLFNSTNTTDPTFSDRPNLTNYDYRVNLPDRTVEEPAPESPPLVTVASNVNRNGPQAANWTVRVPQEVVLPGYMQMGIMIDGMKDW